MNIRASIYTTKLFQGKYLRAIFFTKISKHKKKSKTNNIINSLISNS